MQLLRVDPAAARAITRFGSRRIVVNLVDRLQGAVQVSVIHIEPGGEIGRHPAASRQFFLVVRGEGWVQSGDGIPRPISPGVAALWEAGEEHAAGSDTGLMALVLESDDLTPERHLPPAGAPGTGPA